jgi:hypothetical protein
MSMSVPKNVRYISENNFTNFLIYVYVKQNGK